MKNTSTEFNTIAENPFGAKYIHKIIDLTNNTEIKDDIDDFLYSAMINDDDVFTIGNTCSATISFSIINPTVNLNNKEIEVYQGLNVNGTIEYVKLGIFKVLKPKKDRNITRYQCVDRMTYLMNMPYSSNLTFPTIDVKILEEICSQVGITLVKKGLISHSISKKPSGYTKREIIAYISQLQGKNARINSDGKLELIWYTDTGYVVDDNKIYYDGTSDVNSEIDYKVEYLECTVRSLDGTEESVIKAGTGTNGIKIENPFMTYPNLYELANKLIGFTFRGAEFEFLGDFRLEVGDIVSVETNGEVYRVPIMQIEHKSDGGVVTTITSVGETDIESEIDLSSPNIHAMDRYYAELVLINKAMINKLSVDEADIKYLKVAQLEGIEANIENAVIKNLEGEFITVGEFEAEKARILMLETNSLTASSAIITDLQAGVTKTNTLIFGSATGDTIQTKFSNSVIAQLGDAQIESAMIKEILASKITGLDLNTSKFTVHSEDGKSLWTDNTILIRDGSNVPRVQIGKDIAGDYSMYVWNSAGQLMFDALGVTAEGIARKIIKDDMVADNADINVGKLNIESLFNEINNNTTYTLKSSKIYLDDEKQTLDVSFKVMSSNISDLQSTQTTQGTDISTIQGYISSKIWQQDITTAIDNLEIGGRNLVPGTSSEWTAITIGQYLTMVVDLDMAELCEKYNLKDGDILTYSVYLKSDSGKTLAARWQKWNSQSDRKGEYSEEYITNGEGISTVQVVIDKSYTNLQLLITNISTIITDVTTEYYKCIKLEKGNKATDWTVAPEDIDTNITALNTQYSSISQSVNSISGTVASHTTQIQEKADANTVTKISDNLTLMQADLDGFKTTVSNTYTTKTDFNNLQIGGRNYIHYGKGNVKKGFFANFDSVTDEYGEVTITSKNDYSSKDFKDGFIIHTRDWEVGATIVFSYDVMYTQWDFPEGTSIRELWMGQRYTRQYIDGADTTGAWTGVTQHNFPRVGQNGCELNKWYHVEVVKVIPEQAAAGVGAQEGIQFSNPSDTAATITFRMKNVKIEYGTKATDWTPAPEDIEDSIADVDAKFANYSTTTAMHSAIDQKADSISQAVSALYTTKTEFNALDIGGRNLVINSSKYRKDSPYTRTSSAKDGISVTDMYMPCKNGETYTFQCCTDGIWGNHTTNGTATGWIDIVLLLQTEGQTGAQYARAQILTKAPELGLTGKQTWTYTVPDNDAKEYTQITFRFDIHSDGVTEHTVNWWDLKAERGNKATDWTPAPEDVDANIANVDAKFSSYSTTAEMLAKIDIKAGEITQSVSETYTTKTEFNNLEIGGKNYLTNSNFINGLTGWSNTSNRYVIDENKLFEGVKSVKISRSGVTSNAHSYLWQTHKEIVQPGDTFTTSAYYYTDDVDGIDGATPRLYLDFYDADKNELEASSSYISLELENGKWVRNSLTRVAPEGAVYVETYICRLSRNGTLWIAKPQLEKSSKATDWAPALEDIQVEATSAKSVATQTANMMDWLVESGTSATNFTLTDRMAELTAQKIKLNGYLEVDGDMLVDGAITTDKLATDAIMSKNFECKIYDYSENELSSIPTDGSYYRMEIKGSKLDLQDGSFLSENLSWTENGYARINTCRIDDKTVYDGFWNTAVRPATAGMIINSRAACNISFFKPWITNDSGNTSFEVFNSDGSLKDDIEICGYINYEAGYSLEPALEIGANKVNFYYVNPSTLEESTTPIVSINDNLVVVNGKTEMHGNGLELYYTTPYIDFHFKNNSNDHTARIVENSSGALTVINSISNASDRRLKQDFCSLDRRYLNALNLFKPISYRFIKGSDNLNIGFVAQDIEKALIDSGITDLPLISTDDKGMYALDYNQITALNTLGHIDHEERIQKLENELAIANAIIQSLLLQQISV